MATVDEVYDLLVAVNLKADRLLGNTSGGGGTTTPPPVPDTSLAAPANLVATISGDRRVTLTWDTAAGVTWDVHEFLVDPKNTFKANVTTSTRVSSPLAGGNYQYAVLARNSSGETSPFSTRVSVFVGATAGDTDTTEPVPTPVPSPTPTTDPNVATRKYPAQVMNLKPWKMTIPAGAKEITQPALNTYSDKYFSLTDDKTGIRYRVWHGGDSTANSSNPRSELREMNNTGSNEASWSTTSGTHTFEVTLVVNRLTKVRPHVVLWQIHDSGDDTTVFRLEGAKLYITNGDDTHAFLVTSSFKLGTKVKLKGQATGGKVKYWYNGVAINYTLSASKTGCYFKAGNYLQSNPTSASGESTSEYSEVTHYAYTLTHS